MTAISQPPAIDRPRSAVAAASGAAARHGVGQKNRGDRIFFFVLRSASLIPVLLMLLFIGTLITGAMPAIKRFGLAFLYTSAWDPRDDQENYGALAPIYGTLFSSLMALAIAGPVGIGVAAFLNEAVHARVRSVAAFLIEILATIPSIVYGIWAFFVLVPTIARYIEPAFHWAFGDRFFLFRGPPLGQGLLAGTLVLAVMILPLIVSISLDAIRSVPSSYREAALALGATRWEMIRTAVLPPARSGLIGACILALGRALGETMAITMVIGSRNFIKWSLFEPAATISSTIADTYSDATDLRLAAITYLALILFTMTIAVNLAARALVQKFASSKGVLA